MNYKSGLSLTILALTVTAGIQQSVAAFEAPPAYQACEADVTSGVHLLIDKQEKTLQVYVGSDLFGTYQVNLSTEHTPSAVSGAVPQGNVIDMTENPVGWSSSIRDSGYFPYGSDAPGFPFYGFFINLLTTERGDIGIHDIPSQGLNLYSEVDGQETGGGIRSTYDDGTKWFPCAKGAAAAGKLHYTIR